MAIQDICKGVLYKARQAMDVCTAAISPQKRKGNELHKSQSEEAQNRSLWQNSKAEFFPTDRNVEVEGKNSKV